MLPRTDLERYWEEGYLLVPGLISEREITSMLQGIDYLLCTQCSDLHPSSPETVAEEIHSKIDRLRRTDRRALGKVYDGIRKLQAFWAVAGGARLSEVAAQLLNTPCLGLAFRGCGIRLDLPNEDQWRSDWHQEYHSQISSPKAVTAWFSLGAVTQNMGPVRIARGSHREGLLPVRCADPLNQGRDYTRTFEIPNLESVLARYPIEEHETQIGDVVFLDFMTLHQSGFNRHPERSRVTCQTRFFDMADPSSVARHWVGGWQDGGDFTRLHPEKVVS